jgi:hypothetical protein
MIEMRRRIRKSGCSTDPLSKSVYRRRLTLSILLRLDGTQPPQPLTTFCSTIMRSNEDDDATARVRNRATVIPSQTNNKSNRPQRTVLPIVVVPAGVCIVHKCDIHVYFATTAEAVGNSHDISYILMK